MPFYRWTYATCCLPYSLWCMLFSQCSGEETLGAKDSGMKRLIIVLLSEGTH